MCPGPQQKGSLLPEIADHRSGKGSSPDQLTRAHPASPRPTGPSSAGRSRRPWSGGPGSELTVVVVVEEQGVRDPGGRAGAGPLP